MLVWPPSVEMGSAVGTRQIRAVWSLDPASAIRPLGEKATAVSASLWPRNVATASPDDTRHNMAVRSLDPVSTRLLSGENAIALTPELYSVTSSAPLV